VMKFCDHPSTWFITNATRRVSLVLLATDSFIDGVARVIAYRFDAGQLILRSPHLLLFQSRATAALERFLAFRRRRLRLFRAIPTASPATYPTGSCTAKDMSTVQYTPHPV